MNLFFDLDGTLIDSRGDIANSVNLTRQDYGLQPLPLAEVTKMVGNGMRQLMLRAMPDFADKIDELVANNKRQYREHLVEHTYLYPGVAEALKILHEKGHKIAVCSNKTGELIPKILEKLDVLKYFSATAGAGEVENLKPASDLLFLAAKKMNSIPSKNDWVIGDHYTDMEVGANLGMHICHCAYGFGNPRGQRFDVEVNDLREFADFLNSKE